MNDPIYAEALRITVLKDQQMMNNNKMNPDFKILLKKAKVVE